MSLSFSWLPVYIVGWFFGPIAGFVFGFATDTICWAISGTSIWFWMYAIQEPIVGLIAGIIQSCYRLLKDKSIIVQIIIQKIIVLLFVFFTILIIMLQFNSIVGGSFSGGSSFINEKIYIIVLCVSMFLFLSVNEIQNIFMYRQNKKNKNTKNFSIFIFVTIMIITSITIFSFILGPISYIEYYKYVNHIVPNKYLQYGVMYYLIPRVMKESIKTPIYIVLAFSIIIVINNKFYNTLNSIKTKW